MMFGGTLGLMGGGVWLGGALGEPRARYSDAMVVSGAALTSCNRENACHELGLNDGTIDMLHGFNCAFRRRAKEGLHYEL
ncbi:MAG: hypothetical protein AAGH90_12970, partial [Pseudomonadota bacterium]